jgi:phosphatidate cytidylyltransferase
VKQRVITAVVALVVLAVVLFWLPAEAAAVAIALVILAGGWEWSAFLATSNVAVRVSFVVVIAVLIAAFSLGLADFAAELLLVSLGWWVMALVWTFFYPTSIPAVVRWVGGILVLVPLHAALVMLYEIGPTMLLFMLLIVWVADSGAYFAGKNFGRVKLAPQISPGKTWEGVIGGLIAVVLLVVIRSFWVATDLAVVVPFCLAVAILSVVGDLTVSMFKRDAGIKDSGRLFPGHGGVLDRIDSVAAAAPLFVLGVKWVGLQ